MPNIPYPEFKDFHLKLERTVLQGAQSVEGFVFLSMNELPNCVKDILIACRCCFRYRTDDGTTHTVLLHEEIQRNATPFDEEGIPEGDYEFPFSFSFPTSLPPSVNVAGGWDPTCNCRLWYEVRAYVMHAENHPSLERKHLRTSVKFQRCAAYGPTTELAPTVEVKKDYNFKKMEVRVDLDKDVYVHGEPITATLAVKHDLLRGIHTIRIAVRQTVTIRKRSMRQVREFVVKHVVGQAEAPAKQIKRHQMHTTKLTIEPKYVPEENPNMVGGVALAGALDQNAPPVLSPTIHRHTSEGIDVSYHIVVNLSVFMSSDFVVSVPFTLSDVRPSAENTAPPSYWEELDADAAAQKRAEATDRGLDDAIGDQDDEEHMGQLPSYEETMRRKSLYTSLAASAHTAPHNANARQMQMSRAQLLGSTDDFNHLSHNLNGTERDDDDVMRPAPQVAQQPQVPDIREDQQEFLSNVPSDSSQLAGDGEEAASDPAGSSPPSDMEEELARSLARAMAESVGSQDLDASQHFSV
eukprot:comp23222_c0_seq1/m.37848 comp23222_c0_seq1/g.37848  ORF comp23222_c0_seq1/g.37848 comp23222_c0_seq1/m.37848 type:complete len:523 (-) comp23222_c0_seq1:640-2208(-)